MLVELAFLLGTYYLLYVFISQFVSEINKPYIVLTLGIFTTIINFFIIVVSHAAVYTVFISVYPKCVADSSLCMRAVVLTLQRNNM